MIRTTKSFLCFLSLIFFYLVVEIASLTVDDQLVTDDAYHSPDGDDMKRASAFLPMRGRREQYDEDKRASFQPMRGKKDDLDSYDEESKRANSFMPMRGRKAMYSEGGPLMMLDDEGFMRGVDKRATAFLPMRGRKANLQEGGKRASSFMPMRGRKNSLLGGAKRVGFMPMRGKKSEEEDEEEEDSDEVRRALEALASGGKVMTQEDKRASNFFAMRGKREAKSNHNSRVPTKRESMFFPTRGKRSTDE